MTHVVLLLALIGCATTRSAAPPRAAVGSGAAPPGGESGVRFDPDPPVSAPPDGFVFYGDGSVREAGDAGGRLPPAGRAISLDLVDAELTSVLRLVSDVSDLDFVVDDSVHATVTVQLHDVPWNHALAAILASHGLEAVPMDGGGVRIVPREG